MTLARGADDSPLLEAVARERLVKIQKAERCLECAMEIRYSVLITSSSELCV
jgi:hypothetical protein